MEPISYRIGDQDKTRVPIILTRNPNSHNTRRVSVIPAAAEGIYWNWAHLSSTSHRPFIPFMSQALALYIALLLRNSGHLLIES
jgi:hypothetical protein